MAIRQRLPYWPRLRGTRVLSAAFWWWHGRCLSPCEPCVCLPSLEFMPMSERLTLPVLPLREVVLFPGVSTPVGAGRPATLRAIEAALKTDSRRIFAVAQRENADTVSPDVLYTTGTIAKISQIQRGLGDRPSRIQDRKSTRLNSSHSQISYAVFCLKKKKKTKQ